MSPGKYKVILFGNCYVYLPPLMMEEGTEWELIYILPADAEGVCQRLSLFQCSELVPEIHKNRKASAAKYTN